MNDTECAYCIHVGQSRWFQGIVGCRGTEQTCCFCHWKILKVQIGLWFFLNIHPFRLVTQISRKNYVKVLLASQPGRQWILSGALYVASAQLCHVHELLPRLHRNPSALKLALSWRWCQLEKEGCSRIPASQQTIYENIWYTTYVYRDCCYTMFVWIQLSSSSHLRNLYLWMHHQLTVTTIKPYPASSAKAFGGIESDLSGRSFFGLLWQAVTTNTPWYEK